MVDLIALTGGLSFPNSLLQCPPALLLWAPPPVISSQQGCGFPAPDPRTRWYLETLQGKRTWAHLMQLQFRNSQLLSVFIMSLVSFSCSDNLVQLFQLLPVRAIAPPLYITIPISHSIFYPCTGTVCFNYLNFVRNCTIKFCFSCSRATWLLPFTIPYKFWKKVFQFQWQKQVYRSKI